jgi:hypothetical protein
MSLILEDINNLIEESSGGMSTKANAAIAIFLAAAVTGGAVAYKHYFQNDADPEKIMKIVEKASSPKQAVKDVMHDGGPMLDKMNEFKGNVSKLADEAGESIKRNAPKAWDSWVNIVDDARTGLGKVGSKIGTGLYDLMNSDPLDSAPRNSTIPKGFSARGGMGA